VREPTPHRAVGPSALLFLVGLACQAALAPAAENRPILRAAIQPPARQLATEAVRQPVEVAIQCLATLLHERLLDRTGFVLVDPERFTAIRADLTSAALVRPRPLAFEAFAARLPIDLLVHWQAAEGGVAVTVATADQAAPDPVVIPYAGTRDFRNLVQTVATLVAERLGLGPDEAAALAKLDPSATGRVADEALVAAILSPSIRVEWGDVGLAKIENLAAHLDAAKSSPTVARAVLEAGLDLGRGNQRQPVNVAVQRLRLILPFALGTAAEPAALAVLENMKYDRDGFEADLIGLLGDFKRTNEDSLDADFEDAFAALPNAGEPGLLADTSIAGAAVDGSSVPRQSGCLRALAAIQSKRAAGLLAIAAKAADPRLRRAAAQGFQALPGPAGDAELSALASDHDLSVAIAAISGLAARGRLDSGLLPRVRSRLEKDPGDREALELLCLAGAAADLPAIRRARRAADPRLRIAAWQAEDRLGTIADGGSLWLADPDRHVVAAALERLSVIDEAPLARIANDPVWPLAEAARLRLAPLLPTSPRLRRQRQLAIEHPYLRSRIVESLAADGSADAIADLAAACSNADHIVRADALTALARVAPDQARGHLMAALGDPYRIVRLHAAAAAAASAGPAEVATLEQAVRDEADVPTRLHLTAALARARGGAAPSPRPAAHVLGRDRNQVFLCGHGPGAAGSPFRGYYDLAVKDDPAIRAAHAAGKLVLARVRTAPNPTQVPLSRDWRDSYWLPFDEELLPAIDFLDGVVIGEETMYFRPFQAWPHGWRLFCLEAGIDPARVAGDRDKLSEREKQAWWSWEQRVAIEGFNRIHDLVKLRYGPLRPGFQTATFMPDQNGPCLYDRDWKFDIAAAYFYDADNRERYARIRRLKTVWPDRPVLWLSYGIVNAESTSGGVKHDYRLPMRPQQLISSRAYADSVAAWLAGGHTGFFQSMLFMNPTMKPGPMASGTWITLEDLYPGSPVLEQGLDTVYRGLADILRLRTAAAGAAATLDLGAAAEAEDFALEEPPLEDAAVGQVKREREALRRALLLERRLLDDIARLLAGLPFPASAKPALLVGDQAARRGVFRLPAEFDALDGIDKLAAQPLDGYRFIAIAADDRAAYRDAAIDAVTHWLATQSGVLCVQGWLSTEGALPLALPDSLDASFRSRWPWQDDLTRAADGGIRLADSPRVKVLAGTAERPEAVSWRGDGMRAAVILQGIGPDPGGSVTAAVVAELARLAKPKAGTEPVGMVFAEPAGLVTGAAGGLTGFAAGRQVGGQRRVPGMDLLTGRVDLLLDATRAAALVGDSYRGEFVVVEEGLCLLGDAPLEAVEKITGGIRLRCAGLVRAVASDGVAIEFAGPAPPEVSATAAEGAEFLAWLLESDAPGIATLPQPDGPTVTFVRSPGLITARRAR
jgi:hypothetical protein